MLVMQKIEVGSDGAPPSIVVAASSSLSVSSSVSNFSSYMLPVYRLLSSSSSAEVFGR